MDKVKKQRETIEWEDLRFLQENWIYQDNLFHARGKGKDTCTECRVPENRRRDEKAFVNEQCKEVEENNRMGKIKALFKKVGDVKGTFHARMGPIKDRNGKDLTEAEEIKKRWQECTEELHKTRS